MFGSSYNFPKRSEQSCIRSITSSVLLLAESCCTRNVLIILFRKQACTLFLSPRLVSDLRRNAHAVFALVSCRSHSSAALYPTVLRGVEPCNWREIDDNERSIHPRSKPFPASARRKRPRVRPT